MESNQNGLIFNIQRFSIQDGPGIRTTVFFKGCPLRCRWCSNPESQSPKPQIITRNIRCVFCGKCVEACPQKAITITRSGRKIKWNVCNQCLKCAEACPNGAIDVVGTYMTIEEVMKEIESDKLFYQKSGGGVTMSGGESLLQWEFVCHLLMLCKEKGIHTAVETCGYAPWEKLEKVLQYTDLVLFDLKHIDPELHRRGTGKSNKLILDNARGTASRVRTWVRIPLISGYNDSKEVLTKMAEFAVQIGAEKVSLLPYHEWGKEKYASTGRRYSMSIQRATSEEIQEHKKVVEAVGIKVTTGN